MPALAAVIACLVAAVAAAPASSSRDSARALSAYAAMQRYLFDARGGTYREQVGAASPAHAWPLSQAIAGAIGAASLPGAHTVAVRLATLEPLRRGRVYTASAGGDVYYDDNEWIAGDLLDWDALHTNPAARARAVAIFAAVADAWDDSKRTCAGGVQWTDAAGNDDRNAVTTANGALLGLRLYALTDRPGYLVWSKRMLAWLDRCLLAPDGLFRDHIRGDGSVDASEWSYNQGSAIAAYVELYETAGDASALARAEQIADDTLAHFRGRWLTAEPPEFAAIFFRDLLALAAVDGRQAYVDAAESYGAAAWTRLRDPRTGLFSFHGPARLLDQAAAVQLYAALATASP